MPYVLIQCCLMLFPGPIDLVYLRYSDTLYVSDLKMGDGGVHVIPQGNIVYVQVNYYHLFLLVKKLYRTNCTDALATERLPNRTDGIMFTDLFTDVFFFKLLCIL